MSDENVCSICCQPKQNEHALDECGHSFCAGCIIRWFREHSSCPICRHTPPVLTRVDATTRLAAIYRRARCKSASKDLVQSVQRARVRKAKWTEDRRRRVQLEKQHKDIIAELRGARTRCHTSWRAMRSAECLLAYRNFPQDEPLIAPRVTSMSSDWSTPRDA